jgi:phage gpG-like protein
MAGTITIELDQLEDLFLGVEQQFEALAFNELLTNELTRLEGVHADYFHRFAGPDGEQWKPNAPSTVKRKGHNIILQDTTRLVQSLVSRTSDSVRDVFSERMNHGLTYGTGVEYARYHMTGTKRMPARRHVGLNEEYLNGATERVADNAIKQLAA